MLGNRRQSMISILDGLSATHRYCVVWYYRLRRNHQGIENKLIEPPENLPTVGRIRCRKELGGMLNYYFREAA